VAENAIQQARALLLLQRVPDAVAAAQLAVSKAADCHGILHDLAVALALLERGRALAATGDIAAAQADYARAAALGTRVHSIDPVSWPLFLFDSMRLAETLGHHADAVRDARALIAALDRADASPTHPWRIEAQLLLASMPGAAAPDRAAIEAALAKISRWPVGVRLQRKSSQAR
jgi:tetratricopeptide (TPR) repeat protein